MTFVYSPIDLAADLYAAGFRVGKGIVIALAVCKAESNYDPKAKNTAGNTPPSTDRGIAQINSYWHPEVSDACAYTPSCAAKEMFRLSKQGSDFSSWSAFQNGSYLQWMDWAWVATDALTRVQDRDTQIAGLNTQVLAQQAMISDRDAQITQLQQTIQTRNSQITDLTRQIAVLTADDASVQAKLQAMTERAITAETALAKAQQESLAWESRVNAYISGISEALHG